MTDASRKRHTIRPRSHHRPRMGRHRGAQYAAAALVAVDCSTPRSSGRSSTGSSIRPGRWSPAIRSGLFGWHTRSAVAADLAELQQARGADDGQARSGVAAEIENDAGAARLRPGARQRAFADNCAPCHGAGGGGAKGYPNLNDNDWLWGGSLDADRSRPSLTACAAGDDAGHQARCRLSATTACSSPTRSRPSPTTCARCRAFRPRRGTDLDARRENLRRQLRGLPRAGRQGQPELGAPNLTDKIWLYGSDRRRSSRRIINGRGGVMPAWGGKLDDVTIKALAVYVHTFGGGEQ